MAVFSVRNLEDTGADHLTVQRNLNTAGSQRLEHYGVSGIIGYFRETETRWEYQCINVYGNATTQNAALNKLADEGWEHYLQVGTRGYFKKREPVPVAATAVDPPPLVLAASASVNGNSKNHRLRKNGH